MEKCTISLMEQRPSLTQETTQPADTDTAIFAPATQISPLNETNCFLDKRGGGMLFYQKLYLSLPVPQQEQLGPQQGSSGSWG